MFTNHFYKLFLFAIFVVSFSSASSQTKSDSAITGTWKGPSICQIKSSPCHDEMAVYHVSKAKEPNTFHFVMNKLVNGNEEEMGTLEFTYDAVAKTLICEDEPHLATWKFQIKGATMEGTAVFKGQLYRVIHLTKQ